MSKDILRQSFNDICLGYSIGNILGRRTYIRHLSHVHQIGYEQLEKKFFDNAKSKGLPTEEDRVKILKKDGRWTDKQEKEINDIRLYVESMMNGKKNAVLPSEVANINRQIEEQNVLYDKKQKEKYQLVGITCESYASRIVHEQSTIEQLFTDETFKTRTFSDEYIEDSLSEREIYQIISDYSAAMQPCSEQNIKKLSIEDFFQSYYYISGDDFSTFYGKPIWTLTLFQLRLAKYAKYYKSIFENVDMRNAPKELYENPDQLVDWALSVDKTKREMEKNAGSAAAGYANMKNSDRKQLGIADDTIDLSKEAAKNGGTLNKEQLMRLFGK